MPQQRLARMRKSFAKNRSMFTENYKYFTTPDKTAKQRAKQPEKETSQMSLNPISMDIWMAGKDRKMGRSHTSFGMPPTGITIPKTRTPGETFWSEFTSHIWGMVTLMR
jgi:hypothetical protein